MKKLIFIAIVGVMLSTTVYADKIEYYNNTRYLSNDMGSRGTAGSTFIYVPFITVTAIVETVMVPGVAFFNLFQDE